MRAGVPVLSHGWCITAPVFVVQRGFEWLGFDFLIDEEFGVCCVRADALHDGMCDTVCVCVCGVGVHVIEVNVSPDQNHTTEVLALMVPAANEGLVQSACVRVHSCVLCLRAHAAVAVRALTHRGRGAVALNEGGVVEAAAGAFRARGGGAAALPPCEPDVPRGLGAAHLKWSMVHCGEVRRQRGSALRARAPTTVGAHRRCLESSATT
jgi:hypothetical protein